MTNTKAWAKKTKLRGLDVERALRSQLRCANDLLAQERAITSDMIAALEGVLAWYEALNAPDSAVRAVRAAIAKAISP